MRTKTTTKHKRGLYIEEDDIQEVEKIAKKNGRSWNYTALMLVKLGLEVVKKNGGTWQI